MSRSVSKFAAIWMLCYDRARFIEGDSASWMQFPAFFDKVCSWGTMSALVLQLRSQDAMQIQSLSVKLKLKLMSFLRAMQTPAYCRCGNEQPYGSCMNAQTLGWKDVSRY